MENKRFLTAQDSLESAQLIEKGERYLGIALGAEHDVDPLSDSTSLAAPEQK